MPLDPRDDPSTTSGDYRAMHDDWELIQDIRSGERCIKAKGEKYLPRYERESIDSYKLRLASTPWRPEFVDSLRNLCAKPFTREVALQGKASDAIKSFCEDVDGCGSNLHSFARSAFMDGVSMGLVAIYATYPDSEPARTLAEEKASGARPYWVKIAANDIIALNLRWIGGRYTIDHIRIKEYSIERDGFSEIEVEKIRSITAQPGKNPAWEVFRKTKNSLTGEFLWLSESSGELTLPEIPIALFFTGQRSGAYRVTPPLADLARMQIEIYRALSREDEILTYAGSPMLKATGMLPPQPTINADGTSTPAPTITVGPKCVLFAPPAMDGVQPNWDFIQPNAKNIEMVSESVNSKINHFRRLALQPQMPGTGTITATSAAIDAAKAHSAIEDWALAFKDVLEQALKFTSMWMREDASAEVSIHTDFGIDLENSAEFSNLIAMRKNGDLSKETLWQEGQRRGILGPQFDVEREQEQIAEDEQGLEPDVQIDPVTGKEIQPFQDVQPQE